ncbi:hypothetical protein ERJ75_001428000 [Trypanosoma vivax]|nr:hypothetical protein TRVL_05485 [Trypanosoma vivax]KAH8607258.1 hypothetical protein ERJ75_001428000 [Trypanosoma vivax]
MRRTLIASLSRSWRPHAELVQTFVAGAAQEPRQLQQARTYLYELKLEEALEDVEDATELLYLMHRVSYPAQSHLEIRAGNFLEECASQISARDMLDISRRLQEEPGSGPLWSRVVFERSWFADRAATLLSSLQIDEHITFCAAYWRSLVGNKAQGRQCQHAACGAVVAISQKLAILTAHRIEQCETNGDVERAISLCVSLNIPLHEDVLEDLWEVIFSQAQRVFSPDHIVHVANILAVNCPVTALAAKWFGLLQHVLSNNSISEPCASHAVELLRAMARLRQPPSGEAFEDLLLRLHTNMSQEEVLKCCESISVLPDTVPRLRTALQEMLLALVNGANMENDDSMLWRLRCLSIISPKEGQKLLAEVEERVSATGRAPSVAETQILIRCMRDMQTFPSYLVSACKASYLEAGPQSFNQQDTALLMYVVARSGEHTGVDFYKEVLNRLTATRKFDRRKGDTSNPSMLTVESVEMVLEALRILKADSLLNDQRVYAILRDTVERQQREHGLALDSSLRLLRLLGQLNVSDASLRTNLLMVVSKSLDTITPINVQQLCEVLVILKSRDAFMFRALLSQISRSKPDLISLTSIAKAARRLKFVMYFQQSSILENVSSLEDWSVSDIALVASTSSEKQREILLALPGAGRLAKARAEDLSTVDLLLLISIGCEERTQMTAASAELARRKPLAAGELEVEDALRALAKVVGEKDALGAVCRCAAAALQTTDENMLMRILEVVEPAPGLPNVFFRVIGKSVLRLAGSMTVNNALRWLELYTKYSIRDDSVGKALLSRARTRSNHCAASVDKAIRKAAAMYGKSYTLQNKLKKYKEKVEWFSQNTT